MNRVGSFEGMLIHEFYGFFNNQSREGNMQLVVW
jgi:hypothetical protein